MPINLKGDIVDNEGKVMTEVTNPTSSSSNDEFSKLFMNTLMNQSGILSSEDTPMDKRLNESLQSSIMGEKKASELSTKRVSSVYDREIERVNIEGKQKLESARGSMLMGQSLGVLRQIESDTDKSLKDLKQRKEELIMQGDENSARKIGELEFQAEQFRQTSRQQTFSNLLAMGGFQLQAKGQALQEKQQNFAEKSAIASIGLQYGIKVNEGDTMESIVSRAAPFASAKQKADLANTLAQTKLAEVNAKKALQGMDFIADDATIQTLASTFDQTYRYGSEQEKQIANTSMQNIIDKQGGTIATKLLQSIKDIHAKEFTPENLTVQIKDGYDKGQTYVETLDIIQKNLDAKVMTPKQAETANEIAKKLQPRISPQGALGGYNLPNLIDQLSSMEGAAIKGSLGFITGYGN